jgi:hypothetical protein
VRLAVDQGDLEVDHRVSGDDAALELGTDALLHGRDVVVRHRAAHHLVDELEACSARQRFHLDVAHRVLAVAAGLLDVPAVASGRRSEGLPQRHLHRFGVQLDAAGPEPVQDHVGV